MDDKRYNELMQNEKLRLTPEELAEGWHFCPDLDYLLCKVGEGHAIIEEHGAIKEHNCKCVCDKGCLEI